MSKLNFFDSLTHPTLNSKWIGDSNGDSFEELVKKIQEKGIQRACAVGLPNVGEYSHEKFYNKCSKFPLLYPVAALTSTVSNTMIDEISQIKNIGFQAIKIHPRLLGYNFPNEEFVKILKICYSKDIIVFYCTYYQTQLKNHISSDPYWNLIKCLKEVPDIKMILVHGGGIRLMEYAELCRHNSNLILDLSMTMMKYRGSSIERDIDFLFNNFDQKICVGSDHPEWNYGDVINFLNKKISKLSKRKSSNILYNNIKIFLAI